jgi:hypothetical protein
MTTIYPNIIYHPDTDTTIFIDTLQEIGGSAQSELVTYQSSVDGSLNTFERETLPRTISLNGKISSDNENTLRRQLQYLRGKQVYLMLGARNLATLAKIRSFDMPVSVGTYTPLTLDVICEGSTEGQFWEAEDHLHSSALTSDVEASGGQAAYVTSVITGASNTFIQNDVDLPVGNYTMFVRAHDLNQVTNDMILYAYGATSTYVNKTLTSGYKMYTFDFEVTASDEDLPFYFRVFKASTTTNIIYIDFFGFVRVD